jgi:choline-sulfatase
MTHLLRRIAPLIALLALLTAQCAPAEQPPNVIVVLVDTLNWNALGCNGNPHQPSPNIDAIAAEGALFNQAVSTSGWTLPAVGSLLTGSWPLIHGGLGKGTTLTAIRDELPTAAEQFKTAGFNTIAYANATFLSPALGLDRGFDIYNHRNAFNREIRRADETVNSALEQIRQHRNEANFLLIHLYDPHLDYDPPAGYAARFTEGLRGPPPPVRGQVCRELASVSGGKPPEEAIEYIKRVYLGEVAFVDAQIGRLVEELQRLGLYENTTLVITSDHGEEFWEHGGFEHGHTLYDELIHIPLIMKLPAGVEAASGPVETQVSVLDIMPTLFDLSGIEQPESFAGRSLLPMIRGEELPERPAYSESTLYGADRISWRGSRYKYLHELGAGAALYDLVEDPGEMINLIDSEPEVAQRLEAELLKFARELNAAAGRLPDLRPVSLAPEELEALKSLGYIN